MGAYSNKLVLTSLKALKIIPIIKSRKN